MEEIIKRIVDADKEARNAVKAKQQERHDIQNLMKEQDKAIKKKYQDETKRCITQKRTEMDAELESQTQLEQKDFEAILETLQANYEAHKKEWVKEIYDRCLGL